MLIPGMIILLLFHILPMFGIVIAFENFKPAKGFFGSEWVGLKWFRYMFLLPDTKEIFCNTLIIAVGKIALKLIVPLIFAILLSEVPGKHFRKFVQTARRYRTVQIRAGSQQLTAEDPIPDDLRDALARITGTNGAH